MKIGIIGPHPVPYARGGLEIVLGLMEEKLNAVPGINACLETLPAYENSFWNIIDDYRRFVDMDVHDYDVVVSTKYPSWMIEHPRHICAMEHCLRVLYDLYWQFNLPLQLEDVPDELVELVDILRGDDYSRSTLQYTFSILYRLREEIEQYNLSNFPGVLIREIVHYFDKVGMSHANKFFAQSETVKKRKEYYPDNAEVEVLYPGTLFKEQPAKKGKHIFTMSRLDRTKRLDILIRAAKYMETEVPIYIAGKGDQSEELKMLAGDQKNIHFLGFVSDSEARAYYANSLIVPFFPRDEDFGLITVEAMQSHKPVLTVSDSGGPLEFVDHGETGFVCEPTDYKSIAKYLDFAVNNPLQMQEMGERAFDCIQKVSWDQWVLRIVEEGRLLMKSIPQKSRKKIIVLSTFSPINPESGGKQRVYHLYTRLARIHDVTVLVLTHEQKEVGYSKQKGMTVICIPFSLRWLYLHDQEEKISSTSIYDILTARDAKYATTFVSLTKELVWDASIVVCTHPYLFPVVELTGTTAQVVYDAHNVEQDMKEELPKNYQSVVEKVERDISRHADEVWCTSVVDKKRLIELYKIETSKVIVVPNGVPEVSDFGQTKQCELWSRLVPERYVQKTALFVGADHPPNRLAVEHIIDSARRVSDVFFIVMGTVGDAFLNNKKAIPSNVLIMGRVSKDTLFVALKYAKIALHPMWTGAGTNIKILEYVAHGLHVLTSTHGVRGLDCVPIEAFTVKDSLEDMVTTLQNREFWEKMRSTRKNNLKISKELYKNYSYFEIVKRLLEKSRLL